MKPTPTLPVPPDIRRLPDRDQLQWLSGELPKRRAKAIRVLMGQVTASVSLLMLLVIPLEVAAMMTGSIPLAVRLVIYLILAIGWNLTPTARRWKKRQEDQRTGLRELELYRVFLTARLAAEADRLSKKRKST